MLTTAATVGILMRDSIENMEILAVLMVALMRLIRRAISWPYCLTNDTSAMKRTGQDRTGQDRT
jgi:hypothetical protein